jgi:site-specific recombinase XerD
VSSPLERRPEPSLDPELLGIERAAFLAAMLRSWDEANAGAQLWSDDELVERFLLQCSRTGSPETQQAYARDIRAFQLWRCGRSMARQQGEPSPMRSVSPGEAQDWVDHERAQVTQGLRKTRSFNRRIAAVSAFFNWASEPVRSDASGLYRNPLPRSAALPVSRCPRPLTHGDLDRVFEAISAAGNQRDLVLLKGAYLLGCRVSEIAALRWGDVVELEDGQGLVNLLGKGAKARTVRISAATLALFLSIKPLNAGEAGWVFPSGRRPGQHITRQAIGSRVRHWGRVALGAAAEVSPVRLRSSHATHAIRTGVDLFTLLQTLGHRSAASTQSYVAANPADSSSLRLG